MADEGHLLEEQRENWGSRGGFILAAIGSAVGLGNLWGFPYKLYENGGGAFLIPYVIAMLLIGIPLLIAEFSLGHLTQRATPEAFGRANRKFAFVGWWQIVLSFIIVTFYAVILAYCASFLYYSVQGIFTGSLPWAGEGVEGVEKAKSFYFSEYLGWNKTFSLGGLQGKIVFALAITWLAMYLCIFRGVKAVSKVVLWTVPVPWLMLLILTVRGMTLPGAVGGLEYYLEPQWAKLAEPEVWRQAFGQMFFSLSLAFGIMITYASFLHRKSDLNNNAAIIGLADLGTSFVAGLAIFATIGAMAYATAQAGNPVPVEKVVDKGVGLAFVAFPYALAQLGAPPVPAIFSTLFFSSLLLLGIDSAFSITECILASVTDKTGWKRGKTLVGITLVGFAAGVFYCFQSGLTWIGTFSDYINGTWGIALTALLEALVLGWLFRIRRLREHANERSDWNIGIWFTWLIRLVIPLVMAALFMWSLFDDWSNPKYFFDADGKLNTGTLVGLTLMAVAPIVAVIISAARFKRGRKDEQITHDYSTDAPHGYFAGFVSLLLATTSAVAIVMMFREQIGWKQAMLAGQNPDSTTLIRLAFVAAGAALIGLFIAGLTVVRYEARTIRTSMPTRLGAAGSILMLGLAAGLSLAAFVAHLHGADKPALPVSEATTQVATQPTTTQAATQATTQIAQRYDGELSGVSYIIMGVMFGIIVIGLGWCFYRAIKAAGGAKEEPQLPEDREGEDRDEGEGEDEGQKI